MVKTIAPVNTVPYVENMTRNTLTTNAWIEAAFRALTIGGPQAIRAEAIARNLNVSKGSFYWHFANVDALKRQMLQHWKMEATDNIIVVLKERAMSPADRLRQLVEVATGEANAQYGGVMAEAAIRDWARCDALAAQTVKTVDVERLDYLDVLFAQCSKTPTSSRTNSVILYGALIGIGSLSHSGLADLRGDLTGLLEALLNEI
jgi:AcrR family transcriptional regulator